MNKNSRAENRNEKRAEKYESAVENFSNRDVPQKKSHKKKQWLSLAVLVISIGIGIYFVLEMSSEVDGGQKSFAEAFSSVSFRNAAIGLCAFLGVILLGVFKFSLIIHATTDKITPLVSAKVELWGRFYDNITPSATGGQPAQILYLHGRGMSAGLSTAIVFIKYSVNSIAWVLVGGILMATNTSVLANTTNGDLLGIAGWIGWSLNMLLQAAILSFVIMPKASKKLAQWIVSLGCKMKIIKNKEKVMQKALGSAQDFRSSFIIIAKRPLHLILLILTCVAEISLSFGLPYFVIKMFNGYSASEQTFATLYSVMGLNAYANFGASMVPTPGGSGAIEGLFVAAFGEMARESSVWVTFTYRFATYYIYILIGLGITVHNFVQNIVRSRKHDGDVTAATVAKPERAKKYVSPVLAWLLIGVSVATLLVAILVMAY